MNFDNNSTFFAQLQPEFDSLPDLLKSEKNRQGLTNQQLSDISGVPLATTSRILSGSVANPGIFHVCALCAALGLSLDELLGGSPPPEDQTAVLEKTEQQVDLLRERSRMMEREILSLRRFYASLVFALCGLCAVMAAALMTYMILDAQAPTVGLIREGYLSPVPVFAAAAVLLFAALLLLIAVRKFKKSKE